MRYINLHFTLLTYLVRYRDVTDREINATKNDGS